MISGLKLSVFQFTNTVTPILDLDVILKIKCSLKIYNTKYKRLYKRYIYFLWTIIECKMFFVLNLTSVTCKVCYKDLNFLHHLKV